MPNDEKFFAWLDGELTGEESAQVGAEVASDSRLTELAERHRAMQQRMRSAFDQLLDAPIPPGITTAADEPKVVSLAGRTRPQRTLPPWAALAATLAIGIVVGTIIPREKAGPVEAQGGQLYAAASLDRALDTQLASAPGGEVRIGLTFRDRAGTICRSFTAPSASGLACRDGDRWQLKGLLATPPHRASDYRMAGGTDPALATLIDSTMSGEPFDAAKEHYAMKHGWR